MISQRNLVVLYALSLNPPRPVSTTEARKIRPRLGRLRPYESGNVNGNVLGVGNLVIAINNVIVGRAKNRQPNEIAEKVSANELRGTDRALAEGNMQGMAVAIPGRLHQMGTSAKRKRMEEGGTITMFSQWKLISVAQESVWLGILFHRQRLPFEVNILR